VTVTISAPFGILDLCGADVRIEVGDNMAAVVTIHGFIVGRSVQEPDVDAVQVSTPEPVQSDSVPAKRTRKAKAEPVSNPDSVRVGQAYRSVRLTELTAQVVEYPIPDDPGWALVQWSGGPAGPAREIIEVSALADMVLVE